MCHLRSSWLSLWTLQSYGISCLSFGFGVTCSFLHFLSMFQKCTVIHPLSNFFVNPPLIAVSRAKPLLLPLNIYLYLLKVANFFDSLFIKMHLSCCMSVSTVIENSSVFRTPQSSHFLIRLSKNGNRPNFRFFFLIRDDRNVQKPTANIIYFRRSPLKPNNISGSSGFTTNRLGIPSVATSTQNRLK